MRVKGLVRRGTVWRGAMASGLTVAPPATTRLEFVQQPDVGHFSQTDDGCTDRPAVCRNLPRRCVDLDPATARATQHLPGVACFRWPAERIVAAEHWSRTTLPECRQAILQTVRARQIAPAAARRQALAECALASLGRAAPDGPRVVLRPA